MVSPGNNAFILIEQGLIDSSRHGGDSVVLFHPGQLEIKTQHDIWLWRTQAQDGHPLYQEQLLKSCSRAFQQLERLVQLQCMWLHLAFTVLSCAFHCIPGFCHGGSGPAPLFSVAKPCLVSAEQGQTHTVQASLRPVPNERHRGGQLFCCFIPQGKEGHSVFTGIF